MKRSEMEAKLTEAIEKTFGCDEVGTVLCPPSDYIAFVALKCIEDLVMLPPIEPYRTVSDLDLGVPEWEEETLNLIKENLNE
jgi:hypothetical protein